MDRKWDRKTRGLPAGGIDPSAFSKQTIDRKAERKTRQLCREVRDALSIALGELDDETLDGVWVSEVISGGDPTHLRVIIATGPDADVDGILEALRRASGFLRSEVASAIARKRTPLLTFEVHGEVQS